MPVIRHAKPLTFESWIDKKGVDCIAEKLDVNRFTVLNWRANRCDPRVDHLRAIKRLSRGQLSYDQLIDRTTTSTSKAGK